MHIVGAATTGSFGLPMSELEGLSKEERDARVVEVAAAKFKVNVTRVVKFSSSQEGENWVVNCGYGEEVAE